MVFRLPSPTATNVLPFHDTPYPAVLRLDPPFPAATIDQSPEPVVEVAITPEAPEIPTATQRAPAHTTEFPEVLKTFGLETAAQVIPLLEYAIVKPSNDAYTQALNYQVVTYAKILDGNTRAERLKSLSECKQMISDGYGLVAGFVCFDNIWSAVDGVIPLPAITGKIIGGHAIFLCGYDEVNQRFKFKHSWSHSWGDQGYGYLPYEYLLQGYMWDIWTVFQQEDNNIIIGMRKPMANEELILLQSRVDIYGKAILASNIKATLNNRTVRNSLSSINSSILTLLRNMSIPVQARTVLTSIISQHNTLAGLVNQTEVTIRQSDNLLNKIFNK